MGATKEMITTGKFIDLTGQRFGRLTVICRADNYIKPNGHKESAWLCRCECGKETVITRTNLKRARSCGCSKGKYISDSKITHGMSNSRLYRIWRNMKNRCYNPNVERYNRYGGRGIKICDEWKDDFQVFYEWSMNHGYSDKLSIDRIDTNGNYSPNNCRWITMPEQADNKSNSRLFEFNNSAHTVSEWSEKTGISRDVIWNRIKRGWSIDKVLTQPVRKR